MAEASFFKIVVGSGDAQQTFTEKKDLLVKHSGYFAAIERDGFVENAKQEVELPYIHAETFKHLTVLMALSEMADSELLKNHITGMKNRPYALHVPTHHKQDDEPVQEGSAAAAAASSEGPPQKKHEPDGTMVYGGLLYLLAMCEYLGMEAHVAVILDVLYSCIPEWTLGVAILVLELKPNLMTSTNFPQDRVAESLAKEVVKHPPEVWKPQMTKLPAELTMEVIGCLAQRWKKADGVKGAGRKFLVLPPSR
uniref:BTB domain-containing protein n=1 Tax=Vitrella brassicaformis TaxID=1169539 RepID=A0A7S1K902_9ALVE|mmetsp:Transcript_4348/g.9949  ORF Transcript_4348/g.9949 Transcript_4348/m.9949 type:complete len:252 (+) Transcript_4348:124-879(+)